MPFRKTGWLFLCLLPLLAFLLWQSSVVIEPQPEPPIINSNAGVIRPVQQLYRIEVLAARDGWTFEAHRRAGEIAYDLGDLTNAAAHWQAALLLRPADINTLRRVADISLTLQQITPAVDTLRQLVMLNPDDTRSHYYLGLLLAPVNRLEAINHLERAGSGFSPVVTDLLAVLRANTGGLAPALQVGQVFVQHELWAYAENAFGRALETGQGYAEAMAYIGLTRAMQGKTGEAWLTQAVAIDPENSTVHYLQGIYHRNQGNYDASIAAFTLALTYDPRNPAYYVELGNTYLQTSDVISAEYWLSQAVLASRSDPQFQAILDQFYAANAPLLAFAGINPPQVSSANASIQADIGWTLYLTGSAEEAAKALEAALQLEVDNPRALFYQARIALDTGDTVIAKNLLQQVVDARRDFATEAQALVATLE
ncbi:MAG: tetratricopeptide repeat protein [Anaerolineae bacterium]|nr:tetratricopeptide repeat protein [Anaerolineae bacterium]